MVRCVENPSFEEGTVEAGNVDTSVANQTSAAEFLSVGTFPALGSHSTQRRRSILPIRGDAANSNPVVLTYGAP